MFDEYENLIEEGSAYLIENLLVANIDKRFKPTRHKYRLAFMKTTKCTKFDIDSIPKVYFEFWPFAKNRARNDLEFLFVLLYCTFIFLILFWIHKYFFLLCIAECKFSGCVP